MPVKKPIKKLLVITHPLLSGKKTPFRNEMLKELDAILTQCAKEEGTHVILNRSSREDPGFKELLKKIPEERLHNPQSFKQHILFERDSTLKEKLSKEKFAKEVEIEAYGDFTDICVSIGAKGVAEFVDDKAEIKHICILGGRSSSGVILDQSYGVKLGKEFHELYEGELGFIYRKIKRKLGPYADKMVIGWNTRYKLKE